MTDWIDELAGKLDAEERQRNEQRRLTLHNADIVQGRGPEFFDSLSASIQALRKELDEKLGATLGELKFSSHPGRSFSVATSSGRYTTSLQGELDLKAQQIKVTLALKGPEYSGDGEMKRMNFQVDSDNSVFVSYDGK